MEKAMYIMDSLNITQGMNGNYSHQGTKAIDIKGDSSSIENAHAPFTGIVKRIYEYNNAVWLESINTVEFANGQVDYMTIMVFHTNTVHLKVGQIVKQGDVFYSEGTKGRATGNHIHLETAKGKFIGNGWQQNTQKNWTIYNSIEPYNALYLSSNTKVIDGYGYPWKIVTNVVIPESNNQIVYIVKSGDNLTKIAKMYRTTVDNLVRKNGIKDKNLIYIGQKIVI